MECWKNGILEQNNVCLQLANEDYEFSEYLTSYYDLYNSNLQNAKYLQLASDYLMISECRCVNQEGWS